MSVAESTEILRPITQFGCAHACSGVTSRVARAAVAGTDRRRRSAGCGARRAAHRPRVCPAAGTGKSRCVRCRSAGAWRRTLRGRHAAARRPSRALPCSPAARACRRAPRRNVDSQSGGADDRGHHVLTLPAARRLRAAPLPDEDARGDAGRAQTLASARRSGRRPRAPRGPAALDDLLGQLRGALVRGERDDAEAIRVARDHVERALADRAGRAEHRDAVMRRSWTPSMRRPSSSTGAARRDAVDAIHYAAVAGKQRAAILHAGVALEQAFEQVAHHREAPPRSAQRPGTEQREIAHAEPPAAGQRDHARSRPAPPMHAFPRLARADTRRQLLAAAAPADKYAPMSAAQTSINANSSQLARRPAVAATSAAPSTPAVPPARRRQRRPAMYTRARREHRPSPGRPPTTASAMLSSDPARRLLCAPRHSNSIATTHTSPARMQ